MPISMLSALLMVALVLSGRAGAAQDQGTVTEKLSALLDVLNTARGRDGLETETGKACSGGPNIPLITCRQVAVEDGRCAPHHLL